MQTVDIHLLQGRYDAALPDDRHVYLVRYDEHETACCFCAGCAGR